MGAKRVDLALSLVSGEVAYKLVFSPSKHLSPTDILFFARILNIKWLWSNIISCLAYFGVSGTAPEALCFQSPVLRDSPQLYPTGPDPQLSEPILVTDKWLQWKYTDVWTNILIFVTASPLSYQSPIYTTCHGGRSASNGNPYAFAF